MYSIDHVYQFRTSQCTNAADRVNATRELWLPQERADFAVDYAASASRTYARFVRAYITRHRSLRPLGFCLAGKNFTTPSWVPD